MNVVIVESPAKAKTINKYLGSQYNVLASYGHVRDLPAKDGSVRPDEGFEMSWEVDSQSKKRLNEIASAVKSSDRLILATDPDREGEAISWHVLEVLKNKKVLKDIAVERVVFNAITKNAILEAMKNPREIDGSLVDAYLARRALDYLVGFTLSPVLWRKLPGARSAGRVQSVALRLVCEREREIEAFVSQEYWSIVADIASAAGQDYQARLVSIDGQKTDKLSISNETDAHALRASISGGAFKVANVETKPQKRNPYPPFTTSTLQQEASRKLGFAAARTMQIAQKLYEGIDIGGETQGLITYMRTDGVQIADEAIHAARDVIGKEYGGNYLPEKPRVYKTKAKNAQEAHEAIRPTTLSRLPSSVRSFLNDDQFKLYDLIWKRTIASQMQSAELARTTISIDGTGSDGRKIGLRATGSVIIFDGFLTLYQEGRDDEEEEEAARLPKVSIGENADIKKATANQHFTEPPPRFTEATLIKRMEELGIGRPSTYTQTLSTLENRGYVQIDKRRLIPEDKGQLVIAFLESFFTRYVQYDFTAALEENLDKVSAGEIIWKDLLDEFWKNFIASVDEIKDLRVSEVLESLNEILKPHIFPELEDGADPRKCTNCEDGRLSLKVSRFGAFIGCSNYPDCNYTRQLSSDGTTESNADTSDRLLGYDPDSGKDVKLRFGRFGPYFERETDDPKKPERSSLPKDTPPDMATLELALKFLSLPREVGTHPETGKIITAGIGRYGPFVLHDGVYANLSGTEEVFEVGINRAVTLIAEKASKSRRGSQALKELGEHPQEGGAIQVMEGRYGPYVKHGKINATLPKDLSPEDVTLERAVELIAERAAKSSKKKPAKKTTKKATKSAKTAEKTE